MAAGVTLAAGPSPGRWTLDLRRPDPGRAAVSVLSGSEPLEWAGFTLATGDVNADGIGDLVAGAPGGTDDRPSRRGRLYVVFGRVDAPRAALELTPRMPPRPSLAPPASPTPAPEGAAGSPPRTADLVIDGEGDFDHFGRSLVVADVDGDGTADIVAGAPRADGPADSRPDCGEVFIVFGAAGLPARIDLSAAQPGARVTRLIGRAAGDALGSSLAVGDVLGDRLPEIAAGAPLAEGMAGALGAGDVGEAILVPGRSLWPAVIDLGQGAPGVLAVRGLDPGDQAGSALAIGDFDGDGAGDLAVGARGADGPDNQRPDSGEVLLFFGQAGAATLGSELPVVIPGAGMGDTSGNSLALADLDGDRFADLAIGSPLADGPAHARLDAGAVTVVSGRPRPQLEALRALPARADLPGRPLADRTQPIPAGPLVVDPAGGAPGIRFVHGADPGDHTGVRGAADLDGDGREELLVGAEDSGSRRNGRAGGGELVIVAGWRLGSGIDLRATDAPVIQGPTGGGHLGAAAAAGDLDGDARPELIVSAPQAGQSLSGRVYVVRSPWGALRGAPASPGGKAGS